MKIKQAVFPFMFFGLSLFVVAGCDINGDISSESTQTLEMSNAPPRGSKIRLLTITSGDRYWNEQNEIRTKLVAAVNGGEYNIVSVKIRYIDQYIISAEILYDASSRGDGNSLRVLFITSGDRYWDEQNEFKSKRDAVVNDGKYDVVKIHTTYLNEYIVAIEVYYREKEVSS